MGAAVTQEPNDSGQLLPAVDHLEQRLEKKPQQMVADSGYSTRENIEKMAGREIDFLGTRRYENVPRGANLPNRLPPNAFPYLPEKNHCVCPQGKVLHPAGQRKRRPGVIYHLVLSGVHARCERHSLLDSFGSLRVCLFCCMVSVWRG